MSTEIAAALEVGKKLVDYCNQGKFREAIVDLYADDAKHVEACAMGPDMPQVTESKEALLKMNDWWENAHEVHGLELKGPFPHSNGSFAVWMSLDCTASEGPMAGQRMQMEEVCVYKVTDGKISQVEFYWDPTGYGAAPPGLGDQRNFELLLEAGFSTEEVVQIMSANGAQVLGIEDEVGTIAPGMVADLVVIDADIEAVGHLKDTRIVFRHGTGWDAHKMFDAIKGMVGVR